MWSIEGSRALRGVAQVWLAVDQPNRAGRVPQPGISLGIDPNAQPDPADLAGFVDPLLPGGIGARTAELLRMCGSLAGVQPAYVGAFPAL